MKLSCTQEKLNQGLSKVSHVVKKDATLPILSNILFETKEGRLKLSATDLEIGVRCNILGKIEKEGTLTLPADIITSYVNSLPESRVNLETTDQILHLKCESFEANIKGLPSKEFPIIPEVKTEPLTKIPTDLFIPSLNQIIFAAAQEESRPEISGVSFNFKKNLLVLAATDSYRLAEKRVKLESEVKGGKSIIIPIRTAQELVRILSEEVGDVLVSVSENQILFHFNEVDMTSRLIEGQYPKYQEIIPHEFKTRVILDTNLFLDTIKTVSLFSREAASDIKMELDPSKEEITISAETSQVGKSESKIKTKIEGEKNSINFNYRYVLEGLSAIISPQVIFEMTTDSAPAVLKPADSKDYIYIVMPIKQ